MAPSLGNATQKKPGFLTLTDIFNKHGIGIECDEWNGQQSKVQLQQAGDDVDVLDRAQIGVRLFPLGLEAVLQRFDLVRRSAGTVDALHRHAATFHLADQKVHHEGSQVVACLHKGGQVDAENSTDVT